ncbi:MAG: phosphatase PAP2 family protein [Actinomycetota bacterium]|nr:phosphatase PAP2 family protein [Actinomycetota bacterium]MDA3006054.1 phosphatase PAP2 family protein [Actinomycetota bacterium]MDA3033846.1 phosphatase PAP2 family protein [Actinomycetota bacterium]
MTTGWPRDLVDRIDAIDQRIDSWVEPARSLQPLNRVMDMASAAGDWSRVWHLANLALIARRGHRRDAALFALALGAESLMVNQGLKRFIRRPRPTTSGDERSHVRTPSTSSFPSGHASSAAFAISLMSTLRGRSTARRLIPFGAMVAYSRIHVRLHHASDVIAGALVGIALGRVARGLLRRG